MTQEKPMPLLSDEERAVNEFPYSIDRLTWPRTMIDQHEARIDGERRAFVKGLKTARQSDLAKIEALTKLAQELVDSGRHRYECEKFVPYEGGGADFDDDQPCTCGWTSALASAALLSVSPTPEP